MAAVSASDARVGLVYLNNRYHDPTLGTFISVDPLIVKTGEPYTYASGNPVTFSDPTGLETFGDMSLEGQAKLTTQLVTKNQRSKIAKNPDRFSQILWDCWYQGASGCEATRGRMRSDASLLDAAQWILLGFAQQGGFDVDGEFLMSPYYDNSQNVNFVTEIGPNGEVVVSLVHAPSASFKQMAAGGLALVGTAMSLIAVGGLIGCVATGGGGCAVSSLAGGLGAAASGVSATLVCSDGASTTCAWSAGTAVASVVSFAGGAAAQQYLKAAGLFTGGIQQGYRAGSVYSGVYIAMFDIASYGLLEQHDNDSGVHLYGVVL